MANSNTSSPRARLFEWIFRSEALRAARTSLEQSPNAPLRQTAHHALDLGERVLELPGLHRDAGHAALAFEAFRRGIIPALRACGGSSEVGIESPSFASMLDRLTPASITEQEHWQELRTALLQAEHDSFNEQSASLQLLLAREARQLLVALLAPLYAEDRALERALRQRTLRVIGLIVLLVALIAGAVVAIRGRDNRPNLLTGKSWHASSKYYGCQLEEGRCGGNKVKMFFSTDTEKDPWIEYDLQKPTRFSSIRIKNRSDCCVERAVPLVVEYSNNDKDWSEFARREDVFSTVELSGKPTQARYLRLRVDRVSILHLESIELFK